MRCETSSARISIVDTQHLDHSETTSRSVLIIVTRDDKLHKANRRSLALALRLAGHELVHQQRGLDPLLLLDDVFSELDPVRSEQLLRLLPVGQTLVTTASPLPNSLSPAVIIELDNEVL